MEDAGGWDKGASRPSMRKARIGDNADNGAEQGGDQDVARAVVDLDHAAIMTGAGPAIKLQLIQNARNYSA